MERLRSTSRLVAGVALVLAVSACARVQYRPEQRMAYDDRIQLAAIYMQSDQMDRARHVLEGAVRQEPNRREGRVLLGEVSFLQGDLEEADRQFTAALDLDSEDPVVLNNLAWVRIERGLTDQARDLIDRALALDPKPLHPYLDTRARILDRSGRTREALETARMALSLTPEHDIKARQDLETLIKELEERVVEEENYF